MDREIPQIQRVKSKLARIVPWLILVVIVLFLLIILRSYFSVIRVNVGDISTAEVRLGRMEGSFHAEAVVTPLNAYRVEAMTGGRIEAIFFELGDYVQKGQSILKLSNDDLRLSLLAQEASVTDQINNLSNARITNNQSQQSQRLKIAEAENSLNRVLRYYTQQTQLMEQGFVSSEDMISAREEYDIARTRFQYLQEEARTDSLFRMQQIAQLEGAVRQLELSLNHIRKRVNELDVKAPMSGQITQLNLNLGQIVAPGALLAQIEDDDSYYLEGKVDQYYLSRLKEGADARIRHQGAEVFLKVTKVQPRLQSDRITIDIEGKLPEGLKSGQRLPVDIITDSLEDVLFLPLGQYLTDGEAYVYVVDKTANKAEKRAVETGFRNIREIEIISGLDLGEMVITSSYKRFKERETIRIKE
ncbi:MAG: efflux RND transporter periplasmic adaptor subunit [Candidatus Cloacimonetes bacterium]|jgi:HlyD family secretion protein|nr:efflux RND transporter periplasmic adaptor subunit [Candidatus Cloacimonadota bacterium]NLO43799.1 efflux RND transporter periplasmic adaptor subunit [Candidatus Cloacimonadota bacterium]